MTHWPKNRNPLAASALLGLMLVSAGCAPGLGMFKALKVVQAKQIPLDDKIVEGIWNHPSGGIIVLMHKEGDEYRGVVSVGDTRKQLPLGEVEVDQYGPMPDSAARARAIDALETWKSGKPTPAGAHLFAFAGKATAAGNAVMGSWSEGNEPCTTSRWGNFYFHLSKDEEDDKIILMRIYAMTKKMEGGMGGQTYNYDRMIHLMRSDNDIKPSAMDKLKNADNFCRKTAE